MQDVRSSMLTALLVILLIFSSAARALENQYGDWRDDMEASLGVGAAVFPWFPGSNEYRVLPLPVVDLTYKKFLFLSTTQGLGARTLIGKRFIVGTRFLYDYGRPDHGHVKHMSNLDGSLDWGLFGRYLLLPWYITGDVQTAITDNGHSGTYGSIAGGYIWEIDYNWELNSQAVLNIANQKYMDAYFGVDSKDAARTGFERYSPDGGLHDVSVATVLSYYGFDRWRIFGSVGASVLSKDAADSDVVQEQLQWRLFLGFSYKL